MVIIFLSKSGATPIRSRVARIAQSFKTVSAWSSKSHSPAALNRFDHSFDSWTSPSRMTRSLTWRRSVPWRFSVVGFMLPQEHQSFRFAPLREARKYPTPRFVPTEEFVCRLLGFSFVELS